MGTSEKSKAQVRLGVSPLSWTNDVLADLGGDVPLEVCLKDAADIGYEGVELGRKFPRDPQELRPKLSSYGLQLVAGWYSGFLAERSLEDEWAAARPRPFARGLRLSRACLWRVWQNAGRFPLDLPLSQSPGLKSIDLAGIREEARRIHRPIEGAGHRAGLPLPPDDVGGDGRGNCRVLRVHR